MAGRQVERPTPPPTRTSGSSNRINSSGLILDYGNPIVIQVLRRLVAFGHWGLCKFGCVCIVSPCKPHCLSIDFQSMQSPESISLYRVHPLCATSLPDSYHPGNRVVKRGAWMVTGCVLNLTATGLWRPMQCGEGYRTHRHLLHINAQNQRKDEDNYTILKNLENLKKRPIITSVLMTKNSHLHSQVPSPV